VLSSIHGSNLTNSYPSYLIRRRRFLLWRACYRWRRDWPDSVDLPYHLFDGRISFENLAGYSPQRELLPTLITGTCIIVGKTRDGVSVLKSMSFASRTIPMISTSPALSGLPGPKRRPTGLSEPKYLLGPSVPACVKFSVMKSDDAGGISALFSSQPVVQ
jgi:hypothetical protein